MNNTLFTMKKVYLTSLLFLFMGYSHAQIAQWVIPPIYDSIYFANGANLVVTDSIDNKIYWTPNGQRLFATTETVNPFSEGYAVLTDSSGFIIGFYDTKGNFTSFSDYRISVANDFPYFTDGHLIIKGKMYYVADSQGIIDRKKYLMIYPFRNGYAVCRDYENPQKQKGIANFLIDKNKIEVPLVYNNKTYNASDVDFISSVNDEHIAIVIIKKSLFLFDGNDRHLSPLLFPNYNTDKQPVQAKLEGDLPLLTDNSSPVIYARCGKNEQIAIYFDSNLVPIDIYYNNEKHHYTQSITTLEKPSSPLQAFEENNLFGLTWNGKPVIPAQFEAINCCFDNQAFAKRFGKQGMLQVNEKSTFNLSINNGNDIAFRHQVFETIVRIDMPPTLNPSKLDLEVDQNSGCLIDKISKQTKETENGNRAEYSCRLTIPSSITEEPSEFVYPIQMSFDNIKLMPLQKMVNAWHYKYYDITINDAEKEYDKANGLITFPYIISAERFSNEETFPFEMNVLPDSLEVEIQQISATRGICKVPVSELNEGVNYLFIELIEQGCPPISFPFAITYTKPTPKTKNKPAVKENINIKKKTIQEIKYELEFPGI